MFKLVQKPIADVLGIQTKKTIAVREYDESPAGKFAQSHVPQIEPYLFRKEMFVDFNAWLNACSDTNEPALITGPTGSGKSSFVKQLAARLNIPVFSTTCNDEMELYELFGQFVLQNNNTVYMDGPATLAAKFGGWHLIDEIDRLRPGVLVGLNGYMEGKPFSLSNKGGEVISHRTGSRIIATSNTNLVGDSTQGNYNTAYIHDKSAVERFGMIIRALYPADDQEKAILADIYKAISDDQMKYWLENEGVKVVKDDGSIVEGQFITRDDFINTILKFRQSIRDQSLDGGNPEGDAFERTLSTRTLKRWARYTLTFITAYEQKKSALHFALERALTNGCTNSTKFAIHELCKTFFGVNPELS